MRSYLDKESDEEQENDKEKDANEEEREDDSEKDDDDSSHSPSAPPAELVQVSLSLSLLLSCSNYSLAALTLKAWGDPVAPPCGFLPFTQKIFRHLKILDFSHGFLSRWLLI